MLEPIPTPSSGTERETLTAVLHNLRAVMAWKLEGLDEAQARQPMVPSGTSLLGLVQHLTMVELNWFRDHVTAGEHPLPEALDRWYTAKEEAWHAGDHDVDFRIDPEETIATVLSRYEDAIAVADEIVAAYPLDHVPDVERGRSLRWVLIHMIDETARHAGHADILRELIDSTTGYLPG